MRVIILSLLFFNFATAALPYSWVDFKRDMISSQGRVIDYQNNSISHSEGQGYALVLAAANGDNAMFNLVWQWTQSHLQNRRDNLFAWKWGQNAAGKEGILSYNNASDGGIIILWGLINGSIKFHDIMVGINARAVAEDIKNKLFIPIEGRLLLLPAQEDFNSPLQVKYNPSYFIYPAFKVFEFYGQKNFWRAVKRDSIFFYNGTLRGKYNLPSNWATLHKDNLTITTDGVFSYDAIRVPMYIAIAGDIELLTNYKPFILDMYTAKFVPQTFNNTTGILDKTRAPAGFYAIWGLCAAKLGLKKEAAWFWQQADSLIEYEKGSYYSTVLYLLSKEHL